MNNIYRKESLVYMGSADIKKRIWVTWEVQRRNRSLCHKVNAELFEIITKKPRLIRYPLNIARTLKIYHSRKPDVIFVQNPSFVLASLTVIYGKIFGPLVVVDAHNAGIFPLEGKNWLVTKLAKALIKRTPLTIVSNRYLEDYVEKIGGKAVVMPDPLPKFNNKKHIRLQDKNNKIAFICTWAVDEPYGEVIKAGALIDKRIKIYITGNSKGKEKAVIDNFPENIILTGFIKDHEYNNMLASSDIAIDLTNRDNCLVCGAYEAVSMEVPIILSDTVILREYFYKGAIYTENNSQDIANSIKEAYSNIDRLRLEVKNLKLELEKKWGSCLEKLECELSTLNSS